MTVNASSLASGKFLGVRNEVFSPNTSVLSRKIVLIGSIDPTKTNIIENKPMRILSPGQVADLTGAGFMLHRLALNLFKTSRNIETWIVPQSEQASSVAAVGKIALTGTATESGSIGIQVSGETVATAVILSGDTQDQVAAKVLAALSSADEGVSLLFALNTTNSNEIDLTSKSKGTFGNHIDVSVSGTVPAGLTVAIDEMAGGLLDPEIQPSLDALGIGDNQNEEKFTALHHGYGLEASVIDPISIYNGIGNGFVGNFRKEVARPFRSLNGDTQEGEAGLLSLITVSDQRVQDRTNGVLCLPGSKSHPAEFSAIAIGAMEAISAVNAEQSYIDEPLPGVDAGSSRWTDQYAFRDQAVKAGISPSLVKSGVVCLQNVVTFYRPSDVPVDNNGYRSMRNISIIQNIIEAERVRFSLPKWQQITIVEDTANVTNVNSRRRARDKEDVLSEILALAGEFEGLAWIFSQAFTIERAQQTQLVTLRANGTGFDSTFPLILSGEGGILCMTTEFDVSLTVFL